MQRASFWTIVVFAVVALAGVVDLAQPLEGDQNLFLIGAQRMAHGAVLYRDFWDLKQPGIYDFYYVAGVLGGFSPLAVHAFELAYLVVFAVVVWFALARSAALRPAATLAPLFAVGWYYVVSSSAEQLQVEALAGFPLFVTAWLASEGIRRTDARRYALFAGAGLAAGIALVFKLVFLPLAIAIVLTVLALPSETYRPKLVGTLAAATVVAAFAALPPLATLAVLAHGGALAIALATWFTIPPRIVATLPVQHVAILIDALKWFARTYAVTIVLGSAGIVVLARTRTDALTRALFVWLVAGALTILAQRTSWWQYQWLLESVPFGIFAAAGLVALVRAPRRFVPVAVLVLAALCALVPVRIEARKLVALATHGFALSASARERYRRAVSSVYDGVSTDASLVPPPSGARDDVYVMGNPTYYVVTGRTQPLVLNGWSMELLLPEQRDELLREFRAAPPHDVYVSKDDGGPEIMMGRSPAFAAYFARAYRVRARGAFGTLYERR